MKYEIIVRETPEGSVMRREGSFEAEGEVWPDEDSPSSTSEVTGLHYGVSPMSATVKCLADLMDREEKFS